MESHLKISKRIQEKKEKKEKEGKEEQRVGGTNIKQTVFQTKQ